MEKGSVEVEEETEKWKSKARYNLNQIKDIMLKTSFWRIGILTLFKNGYNID